MLAGGGTQHCANGVQPEVQITLLATPAASLLPSAEEATDSQLRLLSCGVHDTP
jgi:hypothetical protein